MSDGEKEGIRSISSVLGKTNMGRREETKTAQGRRLIFGSNGASLTPPSQWRMIYWGLMSH